MPAVRNREQMIPLLAGICVSAITLVVYAVTLSPTVNFVDSGELIAVSVTAGVAHAPGYPLYTLLLILAAAVPIGDAAVRANALSALAGALAAGVYYALIFEVLSYHLRDRGLRVQGVREERIHSNRLVSAGGSSTSVRSRRASK